jgi:4-hydroxythreonine-4-phosphate dehydrogenase
MTSAIGITLGDVTGIGPEITAKALVQARAEFPRTAFVVMGDRGWLERIPPQHLPPLGSWNPDDPKPGVSVIDPRPTPLPAHLAPAAPLAAQAAVDWLREGARRCLAGELSALVTAPVCKESIIATGVPFVGQTEFLSALSGTDRTVMMLLGTDDRGRWLRVALVTTHLPLAGVAAALTEAKVGLAIERAAGACRDLELPRARVAVCGLNPHAGEGGQIGTEEITVIRPAVTAAQSRGLDVTGPWPADTLFHQAYQGACEVVVAMYHDQGLAPLKMVAFDTGVNWTLGLPFIRTSPDHGTAYDIAGQNQANPSSMLAALRLAHTLASRR